MLSGLFQPRSVPATAPPTARGPDRPAMTATTATTALPDDAPLGLQVLQTLERVTVRERAGGGPDCRYAVLAPGGGALLYARDQAGLAARVLGGRGRPLRLDVFDTQHREVMTLRRPQSLGDDELRVVVLGAPAAAVRREPALLKVVLAVLDPAGRPLLRVKGPSSTAGHCDFQLFSPARELVGAIGKRWSGAARAADEDCFTLRFPKDLDVRHKAAVIATCFLIDFLIFDN